MSSVLRGAAPHTLAGFCRRCGVVHTVDNDADAATLALQRWFAALASSSSSSSSSSSTSSSSSSLSTSSSLPPVSAAQLLQAGGKMLAVLVGRPRSSPEGPVQLRYALSGDLLGTADVEGCVPSIIRREDTSELEAETLATVAALTATMAAATTTPTALAAAKAARKASSKRLMLAMNQAVRLANRRGQRRALPDVFVGGGIPSGTADCALPKLLHAANVEGLDVVGVAEAWWGPGLAPVGERQHGLMAVPCTRRCAPIVGHLLCEALCEVGEAGEAGDD